MAFSLENVFYHVHSSYNKLINTTFDYKFYFCLHRSFHQCPKTRSVIKQLYIYTLLERSADISPSAWASSLKLGWLFYLCRRTNDLEATVSPWFSWLFFLISIQILFSVPSYIPFNLIPTLLYVQVLNYDLCFEEENVHLHLSPPNCQGLKIYTCYPTPLHLITILAKLSLEIENIAIKLSIHFGKKDPGSNHSFKKRKIITKIILTAHLTFV